MTRLEQQPPSSDGLPADSFEQRWRAWQERGFARQVQTRRRVRRAAFAASTALLGGFALWLVIGG